MNIFCILIELFMQKNIQSGKHFALKLRLQLNIIDGDMSTLKHDFVALNVLSWGTGYWRLCLMPTNKIESTKVKKKTNDPFMLCEC